jgi:hypothetical protein
MQKHPHRMGVFLCVRRCPTFPPGLGSIIGADRLSFRVRNGTGRFPVAVAAVTLLLYPIFLVVLMGGVVFPDKYVEGNGYVVARFLCW